MDDLPIRLEQFRNAFRPAGGTHGQQIGEESYALRCNGRALSVLAEAADEITRLRAELAGCRRQSVRIYNSGYHAGHHDTVEGQYTHILPCDIDTYHDDIVAELAADGENNDGNA